MILITGGLGYLGIRITEHLLKSGKKIRVATSQDKPYISDSINSCELIRIDLDNTDSLEKAMEGVTAIIHLAALDAYESQKDPNSALLVNGAGTLNLLKASEKTSVKKFIYMSTVHVYSSPLQGFIDETNLPRPLHPYSITHRLAEDYVLEANKHQKVQGVIFRLSNAVGSPASNKGNSWNLVVNDLCKQVIMNGEMQLQSNELTLRDYLPISSVVTVVENALINSSFSGEIFNLSSGKSLSLREITNIISYRSKVLFGFEPLVTFNETKTDFNLPSELQVSNSKLANLGIEIMSDLEREIDQILINCKSWF